MLLSPLKVFVYVAIALSVNPAANNLQPPPRKSIRTVDFRNFSYPKTKGLDLPHSRRRFFKLKNGLLPETRDREGYIVGMGVGLSRVSYGDVTGDGLEEAIIVLSLLTGGSSMPNCVYVYAWDHGRPKLLWAFDTGDRAHGGLRRVRAQSGRLLVELYGDGKIIGKDFDTIDETFRGACCPMQFTRAWYRWAGNGFRLASKPKVLPNPEGHGSPINN